MAAPRRSRSFPRRLAPNTGDVPPFMTASHRHRARRRLGSTAPGPRRHAPRSARRRSLDWALRRAGSAASGLMLLALLGGGALALRLAAGPVSLGDLAEYAAQQVSAEMDGRSIEIQDLVFDVSRKGLPPGLRIRNLVMRDEGGEVIARAPEVAVRVHLLDLLRGVVSPTRIVVSGLSLTVTRDADGAVHGGMAMQGGALPPPPPGAPAALGAVGMLQEAETITAAMSRLQLVEGRDLRLTYHDAQIGRGWIAEGMQMRVRRDGDALVGELMAAQPGATAPWLRLLARRAPADDGGPDETAVSLTLAGATGAEVAAAFPPLAALGAVSAPLTGRFSGVIDDSGAVQQMTARLSAGAGRVRGLTGEGARLDGAQVDLTLEAGADRLVIDKAVIAGGLGALQLTGVGTLRRDAEGRGVGAALSLSVAELALTEEAGFAEPMAFGPGRLAGEVSFDARVFRLAEAVIEAPGLSLRATGGVALDDDGWTADLRASAIAPIAAATLAPNWPRGLAPGGRNWVAEHIVGGTIDTLDVSARFAGGAASADLDFTFSDTSATVLDGMPPLAGAAGAGRVTIPAVGPGRFDISVAAAQVTPPGGAAIALDGSSFAIPDVAADIPVGEITLIAEGALADILTLIDQPPLELISKLGADLGAVGGRGAGTTTLRLPLLNDVAMSEITLSSVAELTDLSLVVPGLGLPAAARTAALTVDDARLTLKTEAVVDGQRVNVAWEETFSPPPGAAPTALDLSGAVGPGTLARLGVEALRIDEGAGWARAQIAIPRAGAAELSVELTFDKAAMAIPAIGWTKAAGAAARAAAAGTMGGGALTLSRLSVDAPGLAVEGRLSADLAGGGLGAARLSRIALDGIAEGALDYSTGADGANIRFDGPFLDFAALFDAAGDMPDTGDDPRPFTIGARVDRLTIADGMILHGAQADAAQDADGAITARISGNAAGGAPVAADWRRPAPGGGSRLRLTADDAGAALRDLGLFEDGRGGALVLDVDLSAAGRAGPVKGAAVIEGMQLSSDGALVRALAAASLFGVVERAGTGGLTFDRIEAPFIIENQVVRLDDALARGASLGITLGGVWNRRTDVVDMRGVLSPAYAINGALNRVPIVGALLGGEGEGLFGVTFTVTGTADDPKVVANPLSALTPGVLRGVFGGTSSETRDQGAPRTPEPERVDR